MIDFLGEKNKREQYLNDLLANRNVPNQINQTRTNIESGRANALGTGLNDVLSGISSTYGLGGLQADTSAIKRRLGTNLNVSLAGTQRNLTNDTAGLNYDQLVRIGLERYGNRVDAENFARQTLQQNKDQANQSWNTNFNIEQGKKRATMGENFAKRGVSLQDKYAYDPHDDYQQALMRILTGLPAQIGTAYALNKFGQSKPQGTGQTSYNPYSNPAPLNERVNSNAG